MELSLPSVAAVIIEIDFILDPSSLSTLKHKQLSNYKVMFSLQYLPLVSNAAGVMAGRKAPASPFLLSRHQATKKTRTDRLVAVR
eukprot:scaffold11973_cov125-Skeletonema_dohrnii-CCMP3373.AAC.2